ncbi:toxin TcdB middle/N-terminal domain-containing protein [Sorangium sp. So ce128]|uniref:toxin TcdB middle/N-terminal domain-containing protein n=1 Tax=Sorangium sp. So ce128 TaxID=3133281 RepID=UPI003F63B9DA
MSGDGLVDLVRIRNGNVCYWPNLGHCRFGAKVQMSGSMRFDHEGRFNPKRIRLADVDGSGATDIVYVHPDGVRFYANNAANTLAAPVILPQLPDVSDLALVDVIDLLGSGTGCLVWASSLPGARPAVRYIDLLGSKKPHLLTSISTNLGRTTTATYAPSTKFYLADRAAGRPWVTRLPFVVYVIERVEVFDAISRHQGARRALRALRPGRDQAARLRCAADGGGEGGHEGGRAPRDHGQGGAHDRARRRRADALTRETRPAARRAGSSANLTNAAAAHESGSGAEDGFSCSRWRWTPPGAPQAYPCCPSSGRSRTGTARRLHRG